MSISIYSLIPKNYLKKSKSSVEFQDVENFIVELRKRIVDDWNYKFEVDNTIGSGYKLKFDQFEKKFLKKFDFVFIIVNSSSEDAFKIWIDKFIKTCKCSEKLENIVVLSLNALYFEELNKTSIKFVCFEDDVYLENANQWDILEDILKNKTDSHSREETPTTNTLPIPISSSGRKSPSKLKTFFHSLPAKFDSDKRLSLFLHKTHKESVEHTASSNQDVRLPNINISEIENEKNDEFKRPVDLRQKADSSKLSLNSLFKKRPKKIRDSGLSLNSSASTGSSSRKSDTMTNRESMSTDGKEMVISSSDHSPVIHIAQVQKTEKHKAKIEVFKAKANKVIRSTSCLHSPKVKRSKHNVANVMHNVANFSSVIIAASSDIGNQSENVTRKVLPYLLNNRGKSEPPIGGLINSKNDIVSNGIIKYYSWNDINNDEKDHLKSNDLELTTSGAHSILNDSMNENIDIDNSKHTTENENINNIQFTRIDLINDGINDEEVFRTTFKPSTSVEIFDENQNVMNSNYTESSYSTFLPSQNKAATNNKIDIKIENDFLPESKSQKLPSPTTKLKDDPMESLDKLIKSIQISCEEMRAARKSQEFCTNDEIDKTSVENDLMNIENKICPLETHPILLNNQDSMELILDDEKTMVESDEKIVKNNNFKEEILPTLKFSVVEINSYREMSPELIEVADSIANLYVSPINLVQQTYQRMIRNPIIVSGIFAATTYTAPIWCSYLPRNVCMSKIFYGTLDYLFYSEVVQSIPNQIISTGRNTASAASKTIKRFLF